MERVKDGVLLEAPASDTQQIDAIVEYLVATCDYYAARCIQESALREEQSGQLAQARQQLELAQTEPQALPAQQRDAGTQQSKLDELAMRSFHLVALGNELAQALERKEKQCARQKVQIDYLNAQVARYQRLVERLKQTWYGKLLIKIYHIVRKLGWI